MVHEAIYRFTDLPRSLPMTPGSSFDESFASSFLDLESLQVVADQTRNTFEPNGVCTLGPTVMALVGSPRGVFSVEKVGNG